MYEYIHAYTNKRKKQHRHTQTHTLYIVRAFTKGLPIEPVMAMAPSSTFSPAISRPRTLHIIHMLSEIDGVSVIRVVAHGWPFQLLQMYVISFDKHSLCTCTRKLVCISRESPPIHRHTKRPTLRLHFSFT